MPVREKLFEFGFGEQPGPQADHCWHSAVQATSLKPARSNAFDTATSWMTTIFALATLLDHGDDAAELTLGATRPVAESRQRCVRQPTLAHLLLGLHTAGVSLYEDYAPRVCASALDQRRPPATARSVPAHTRQWSSLFAAVTSLAAAAMASGLRVAHRHPMARPQRSIGASLGMSPESHDVLGADLQRPRDLRHRPLLTPIGLISMGGRHWWMGDVPEDADVPASAAQFRTGGTGLAPAATAGALKQVLVDTSVFVRIQPRARNPER